MEVVAAVLVKDGCVFCARRPENKTLGGLWEFPGGKVEHEETHAEALEREMAEEFQVEIRVNKKIETVKYSYSFGTIILHSYLCEIVKGTPLLQEHQEMKWVPLKELSTLEWAPADIPTVQQLLYSF